MTRHNRYPGGCTRCGKRVDAYQGYLTGSQGHWKVTHEFCTTTAPHPRPPTPKQQTERPHRPPTNNPQRNPWGWIVGAAVAVVIILVATSNFGGGADSPRSAIALSSTTSQASVSEPVATDVTTTTTTEQERASGTFSPRQVPPVVNEYSAGDFELTLRDGRLVRLRGPVERQITETKTGETGRSYRVGAICRDGWQSSATGRGACSWHGSVDYWLVRRDTKQVSEVSTVVVTETICRESICPQLGDPLAYSNVEAAARYVAVVNDVFDLNVPGRALAKAALDPEEIAASNLVSDVAQELRELIR